MLRAVGKTLMVVAALAVICFTPALAMAQDNGGGDTGGIAGILQSLLPVLIATTGVVALLNGYVQKAASKLASEYEKAPDWAARILAFVVAMAYSVTTGGQAGVPEVSQGVLIGIVAPLLAWLSNKVKPKTSEA